MPKKNTRLTPYQRELKQQKKEHPRLPKKYLRMISHDHVNKGYTGKGH
jgi:hypothetical protein